MRHQVAPVVLAVLLVAGCSGGGDAPAAPASPAHAPATAAPAAPDTPMPPQPAAPPPTGGPVAATPAGQGTTRCTSGRLRGSLGAAEGAAGSVFRTLVLTNDGPGTCELRGFPGVSYVAGDDGHQVGPAAAFDGPRGGEVVLAAGRAATARLRLVDVGVLDAGACRPTAVRGLRIYPPGSTASLRSSCRSRAVAVRATPAGRSSRWPPCRDPDGVRRTPDPGRRNFVGHGSHGHLW
jgi:hypothetical protein